MFSENDNGYGVIKTYWKNIRERITQVEPTFSQLIDELNPDRTMPFWIFYFPWGTYKGDTESPYFPYGDNKLCRLTDPNIPKEVIKHLGYGARSSPMGIVLDKTFEVFIDIKNEMLTIPWKIYSPGTIFSFNRILNQANLAKHNTNNILSAVAGVRSVFMLPHIGCVSKHINLQRALKIKGTAPKYIYSHWQIFKEIFSSKGMRSNWRAALVYFPEKFMKKLHSDYAWLKLKTYLHDLAWKRFSYDRNRIYYDIAFSIIQKKRNLKPNPYITDTLRHLFSIGLGASPGFVPATSDDSLPLNILQDVYLNIYKLSHYYPTVMEPCHFSYSYKYPVYYSMQYPSVCPFAPKSRKSMNTLFEIRELEHVAKIFFSELKKPKSVCSDTALHEIAYHIDFNYFHNEKDPHQIVDLSKIIIKKDKRFSDNNGRAFAGDSKFLRGCISINKINKALDKKDKQENTVKK